jgi:hypothetical protein
MMTLFYRMTASEYGADFAFPPWTTYWYKFLELGAMQAIGGNQSLLLPTLEAMGFSDAVDVHTKPNDIHKRYMPYGAFNRKNPRLFFDMFNEHRRIPDPTLAYDTTSHAGLFSYLDVTSVNEFSYENSSGYEKPSFSFFPFYFVNMVNEDKFVDAIAEFQRFIGKSPLKDNAFVYGDIPSYWEVFIELSDYMWILLLVGAGIIFVVSLLLFSLDLVTATITALSCLMIVLEIYGLACAIMNFNIFVCSITLMGLGLSVEFTAHLAAAFSMGTGTPSERLAEAMAHTFPALMEGSVSTLLSVVPLAFHPMVFIVKYLFGIISLVVVVGLINGLLFMPALLAFFEPSRQYVQKAS